MIGRRAGCPGLYQSWVSWELNGGGAWTSRIPYLRHFIPNAIDEGFDLYNLSPPTGMDLKISDYEVMDISWRTLI